MLVKRRIETIIYTVIALLYAFLMSLIPEIILRDRDSYYVYAVDSDRIFNEYLASSYIKAFTNEPLFLALNYVLKLIIDPELTSTVISFFISFTLIFFFLNEIKGVWLKIMSIICSVFTPFFFHMQLVTLRQSLALAIFLWVTMYTKNMKAWILTAFIMVFIHSSFAILFVLLVLLYIMRKSDFNTQIIVYTGFSVIMSLSMVFVGTVLGMRQTELYASEASGGSGLSFLLYLALLVLLLTRGENFLKKYAYTSLAILGLTVYLSLYFISPIAGRLLVTFLPFIVCSLFNTSKTVSYLFIILFFILNLLTFKSTIINTSLTEEATFFL